MDKIFGFREHLCLSILKVKLLCHKSTAVQTQGVVPTGYFLICILCATQNRTEQGKGAKKSCKRDPILNSRKTGTAWDKLHDRWAISSATGTTIPPSCKENSNREVVWRIHKQSSKRGENENLRYWILNKWNSDTYCNRQSLRPLC